MASSGGVVNYDSIVPCRSPRSSISMPAGITVCCDRYAGFARGSVDSCKPAALAFDRFDLPLWRMVTDTLTGVFS